MLTLSIFTGTYRVLPYLIIILLQLELTSAAASQDDGHDESKLTKLKTKTEPCPLSLNGHKASSSWIKAAAGQMQLEGSESHVANCHFVMFTNMLSSNPPGATSPYYYCFCLLPDITVTFECIWISLVLLKLAPLPAKHVAVAVLAKKWK